MMPTNEINKFYKEILDKKDLIKDLAKRDFKQRYSGTYLGVFWVYFQPFMYISVLYVVFTYGLRAAPRGDVPFASYLVVGMIPWMYFSEGLNGSSSIIKQYSYLVKKINFRLSILPIVKILSSIIPHLVLMGIAILVTIINGKDLSLYSFQLIYFFIAMTSLLFGISLLTSSLNLFLPDTAKFISVVTQLGFWFTPILWDINKIPEQYHWLIQLNPMEYIVTGYRNSLLYDKFIIQDLWQTFYFWGLTLFFIIIGSIVFRKLRPHFAEVV
ncbi:MAG: ABC transporter permease [Campylobacterota bacterium]|nr:ABC transporter permease [Campylobacterota bacterium]